MKDSLSLLKFCSLCPTFQLWAPDLMATLSAYLNKSTFFVCTESVRYFVTFRDSDVFDGSTICCWIFWWFWHVSSDAGCFRNRHTDLLTVLKKEFQRISIQVFTKHDFIRISPAFPPLDQAKLSLKKLQLVHLYWKLEKPTISYLKSCSRSKNTNSAPMMVQVWADSACTLLNKWLFHGKKIGGIHLFELS